MALVSTAKEYKRKTRGSTLESYSLYRQRRSTKSPNNNKIHIPWEAQIEKIVFHRRKYRDYISLKVGLRKQET
ncbi:hypothetical protein Sjap_008262 [Stephania japonica]|uniref:Uncharacterized protein n=1 Tax=Stephania japonica TaxID=461633 RepID=A0AAP0JP59_9MAGN